MPAHTWFRRWGWIHRPASWQGWALVVIAAAFCGNVFMAVDRHSHSVSDTLYGAFPYIVPCLLLLDWAASKSSSSE